MSVRLRVKSYLFERYVSQAIFPYIALSMILLTAMLLVQQGNRFTEVLGNTSAPLTVFLEIMAALLPNVLVFTIPMAVLAGTIIGLSRMAADSELIALNAAGASRRRILVPVLLLGTVFTIFNIWIGIFVAPSATQSLRGVAYKAALAKLESPIDPQVFNTEIPNKVVYVRGGDDSSGQWEKVFIYSNDSNANGGTSGGGTRVITARSGRIDASGEATELVLQDAVSTTLPGDIGGSQELVAEHLDSLRVRLDTGRKALEKQIAGRQLSAEELTWEGLTERIQNTPSASDKVALLFIQQRRLALCVLPLIFAFLGAGAGISVRRGGRGAGVFIAIVSMILFYLLLLAGESLTRSMIIPAYIGAWSPIFTAVVSGALLLSKPDFGRLRSILRLSDTPKKSEHAAEARDDLRESDRFEEARIDDTGRLASRRGRVGILLGLQDVTIFGALLRNFVAMLLLLLTVFHIFTLLEVWRFVANRGLKIGAVAAYLLYLTPLVAVTLAPASMLLGCLVTYALMARRSEAVAWWASGRSVYRLALPGILVSILVGGGIWYTQDQVMPHANRRQDVLRAQIRGVNQGVSTTATNGRHWLAASDGSRIYTYEYNIDTDGIANLLIFDFDESGIHLRQLRSAATATWRGFNQQTSEYELELLNGYSLKPVAERRAERARRLTAQPFTIDSLSISENQEVFKPTLNKASHLSRSELRAYIRQLQARGDVTQARVAELLVALERRHADVIAPLVLTLVGIPLAFAFGQKSAITALVAAVIAGLGFWAVNGAGNLLGSYGLLPPFLAAWLSTAIYLAAGTYLFSKTKT